MKNKARTILIVTAAWILASSGLGISFDSGAEEIAKNEVRIYIQSDFRGPHQSWKLESGLRQRLIQSIGEAWEGRIASIQMGSDVAVMLFQKKYFRFTGSTYVNFNSPVKNIAMIVPGAENKYSSLIIYPKSEGNPLGILAGNSTANDFRFFPLPENKDEGMHNLADIRHLISPIDFILFFPGKGLNSGVAATLYSEISWKGQSLRLPRQVGETRYNLSDLNFAGKAQSLRIEQTMKSAQMKKAQGTTSQKAIHKSIPSSAIRNQSIAGTCVISGAAKGMYAERAILYSVTLYGPNDFSIKRETTKFDSKGKFIFSALPEGHYRIIISPDPGKADTGTVLRPPKQSGSIIECNKGETKHIDIVFDI